MPRPAVKDVKPRHVAVGTKIRTRGNGADEVVRGVLVVLQMANGTDQVYNADEDMVQVLEVQPKDELDVEDEEV